MFRQTMHAAFVLFIISSVWALGWARAIDDRIRDTSTPADSALPTYAPHPVTEPPRSAMTTPSESPPDLVFTMQDRNDP